MHKMRSAPKLNSKQGLSQVGKGKKSSKPVTKSIQSKRARKMVTNGTKRTFSKKKSADITGDDSQVAAILGMQWGDEGKGKLIDAMASQYDVIARFNGGANAGHTLVVDGKKFAFHLLPCGLLYPKKINIIGNGVVLDVEKMFQELTSAHNNGLDTAGRLLVSDRAHLVFNFHKLIDGQLETNAKANAIGTTRRGIGPTYSSKMKRDGIRVGELMDWDHFVQRHTALVTEIQSMYGFEYDIKAEQDQFKSYREQLSPMVTDTVTYINQAHKQGKRILAEGANAALLDVDFGTYPYVTSSSTGAGGISTGLGLAPSKIDTIVGVVKAYTTRVGGGPFPTEQLNPDGETLCKIGREFGTTTGRARRCGWLDVPVVKYANNINGVTSVNITKLDVLSEFSDIQIGTHYEIDGKRLAEGEMPSTINKLSKVKVIYETVPGWKCDISKARTFNELPHQAQSYLKRVQDLIDIPISYIGVGPGRDEMIKIDQKL